MRAGTTVRPPLVPPSLDARGFFVRRNACLAYKARFCYSGVIAGMRRGLDRVTPSDPLLSEADTPFDFPGLALRASLAFV